MDTAGKASFRAMRLTVEALAGAAGGRGTLSLLVVVEEPEDHVERTSSTRPPDWGHAHEGASWHEACSDADQHSVRHGDHTKPNNNPKRTRRRGQSLLTECCRDRQDEEG
jgi:hypothetical protein